MELDLERERGVQQEVDPGSGRGAGYLMSHSFIFRRDKPSMSTAELRKQLIERIKRSRRPELLREALRLMDTDTDNIEVYKVSPEQRKAIAKGLKAAKAGKVIPAGDADRAIDKWLSK